MGALIAGRANFTGAAGHAFALHPARGSKKKREAGFQFLAESYSRGLKPGLPRKTVEDYLKSKGTAFETMWDNRTLTDLVKIGEEDHPWYCSENSVFIRFQFAQAEWGEAALPSGVLTRVDRYDQMRGCL
jgi:hypothetical protein